MHLTFSAEYAMLLSKQTTVSYMDLENWTPMFASISAFLFIAIKYSAVIFHLISIFFLTFALEYAMLISESLRIFKCGCFSVKLTCLNGSNKSLRTESANRLSVNAACLNGFDKTLRTEGRS